MAKLLIVPILLAAPGPVQDVQTARDGPIVYLNPDWSPDGTRIAFESGLDGRLSIYTIGVDGSGLARLTGDAFNDEGPVWSPDGSRIAFYSNRHPDRERRPVSLQVYVMNADGTDQRRLTDQSSALDYNVSWSPDGATLVFQSRPGIDPGVHSLYLVGSDGMGRRRLTDGRFDDRSPAWSPDGASILFVRSDPLYAFYREQTPEERAAARASTEVVLLDTDDGTSTPITDNAVRELDPSWSSAGDAFYFAVDGGRRPFIRHPMDGTPQILVEDGASVSHARVVRTRVSPDGRLLVYAKLVDDAYGIYLFDLETGRQRLLVGGS